MAVRSPLFISDGAGYSVDELIVPAMYRPYLERIIIPHGLIIDRIEKLAQDIVEDYALSAAIFQRHKLNGSPSVPVTFDFVRVKSYEGTQSTGKVSITGMDLSSLTGKHVIIVEDLIDTGLTMRKLIPTLSEFGPASIKVAALLEKRTERSCGFKADYSGFSVPDDFVVGYGIDYEEAFRDMEHIGCVNAAGVERFRIAASPPVLE